MNRRRARQKEEFHRVRRTRCTYPSLDGRRRRHGAAVYNYTRESRAMTIPIFRYRARHTVMSRPRDSRESLAPTDGLIMPRNAVRTRTNDECCVTVCTRTHTVEKFAHLPFQKKSRRVNIFSAYSCTFVRKFIFDQFAKCVKDY